MKGRLFKSLQEMVAQTHCLEVLGNFTDETFERQPANQKLGGLLIASDLTKGCGFLTPPVAVCVVGMRSATPSKG
jgi:hypothetical protein